MRLQLKHGDCLEVLKTLQDNSIDSIVTDPPYGIGFMNKEWDSPEKLREQQERDLQKIKIRKENGLSPVDASFSPFPGQGYKGRKEGLWFQQWCEEWAKECLRVLKPGGHLLSFSAPRMYHRMTCGLEDAGFEVRDQIMWVFGSGFPKSHNIGKAIDKLLGNEREVVGPSKYNDRRPNPPQSELCKQGGHQEIVTKGNTEWEGWGTALKPAHEPIVVARKPISEKTVAENVLKWGTGAINIDESRIEYKSQEDKNNVLNAKYPINNETQSNSEEHRPTKTLKQIGNVSKEEGRWPANIILDEEAGKVLDEQSGISKSTPDLRTTKTPTGQMFGTGKITSHNDKGGASRFFYCPKASKKDRDEGLDEFEEKSQRESSGGSRDFNARCANCGKKFIGPPENICSCDNPITDNMVFKKKNNHPTVKPTALMEYLIRLVTPKGGTVLDPFMGSGSTGKAAVKNNYGFVGIEKEMDYIRIAEARILYENKD